MKMHVDKKYLEDCSITEQMKKAFDSIDKSGSTKLIGLDCDELPDEYVVRIVKP